MTAPAAAADTRPAPDAVALTVSDPADRAAYERQVEHRDVRLVQGLAIASIVLQRLVLPVGGSGLPLLLPVTILASLWAYRRGLLVIDRGRSGLLLLAVAVCSVTAFVNLTTHAYTSINSFVYLLMSYLPFAFVARRPRAALMRAGLETYATTATVFGGLALLQMIGQYSKVFPYQDFLASVVPAKFIATGFNTSYAIHYGSPVMKANAWLFLEPSFLSQGMALGAICVLATGERRWRLALLLGGLVASGSGTGMILLGVGILALTVQRGIRAMAPILAILAVTAVGAALSPVGTSLLERVGEFHQQGSSASLRFDEPFTLIGPAIMRSPATLLTGAGPGASDRFIQTHAAGAVVAPVPIKATYDYGAIGALLVVVAVLWCACAAVPDGAVAAGALTAWFILGGALLEPATVTPLWLLTSLLTGYRTPRPARRGRAIPLDYQAVTQS